MSVKILAAGGGTSGHVYPAIAIADRIVKDMPGSVVEFCGTARGIESDLIPKAGYRMHEIRASGLPSKPSPKIFRAIGDFFAGRKRCIELITEFKPDAVVGTGGYVCSPLVSAAAKMRVPVVLHEQNAFPGRSNRYMARNAAAVCTGFPNTEHYFKAAGNVYYTGNPIRDVFKTSDRSMSRKMLGYGEEEFVVLAMGGSLGARTINRAVINLTERLDNPNLRIVLSTGRQQFKEFSEGISGQEGRLCVFEYIDETQVYMAAADLVICRAGAITCAEIAAVGVPSILIPYPYAAGDHQTYNARKFSETGAGIMIADADLTPERIATEITAFLKNREKGYSMARNAKKLYFEDSDKKIASIILDICREGKKGEEE